MAGTDTTRIQRTGGPTIILVEPQLGENIGTAARAMLNCGLTDLRLVRPAKGWPNERAWTAASGADRVLDAVKLYPSAQAAVADLQHIFAATARDRDMVKPVLTLPAAARAMRQAAAVGESVGLLFGPERTGLTNDDLMAAQSLITIPLNPAFASLNLAQAVLLVAYEWFRLADGTPEAVLPQGDSRPATLGELEGLFGQLEAGLEEGAFFRATPMKPVMWRNIRNVLLRAGMTEQEVRTWRGAVKALEGKRGLRMKSEIEERLGRKP
ncbi:MAG: RNA methyltransferase [Alphaproteobacteria bacterium]|nr:RNA methyltransferase [Alphaproteobacteria bacterium]